MPASHRNENIYLYTILDQRRVDIMEYVEYGAHHMLHIYEGYFTSRGIDTIYKGPGAFSVSSEKHYYLNSCCRVGLAGYAVDVYVASGWLKAHHFRFSIHYHLSVCYDGGLADLRVDVITTSGRLEAHHLLFIVHYHLSVCYDGGLTDLRWKSVPLQAGWKRVTSGSIYSII